MNSSNTFYGDVLDETIDFDYDLNSNVEELVSLLPTETDNAFVSTNKRALGANAEQYSSLLKSYVDNANVNLKDKKRFKFIYFFLSSLLLLTIVIIPILMFLIILNGSLDLYEKLIGICGFTISFIGIVIVIPEKITKYLFNSKEDEYINGIVTTIIAHDEKMFDKFN